MTKPQRTDSASGGAEAERRSLTAPEEAKSLDQARQQTIQTGQSQIVWVTIARDQYERFKKELADMGSIEVEVFTANPQNNAGAQIIGPAADQGNDSSTAGVRESSTLPALRPLNILWIFCLPS